MTVSRVFSRILFATWQYLDNRNVTIPKRLFKDSVLSQKCKLEIIWIGKLGHVSENKRDTVPGMCKWDIFVFDKHCYIIVMQGSNKLNLKWFSTNFHMTCSWYTCRPDWSIEHTFNILLIEYQQHWTPLVLNNIEHLNATDSRTEQFPASENHFSRIDLFWG